MKKHIQATALAVSLLLMVGCGTARSQSEPIPAAEQVNAEQTLGGLHFAQSSQGDGSVWIVSGDQAFLAGERQIDGGCLLQSVDLTTGQRTVLCGTGWVQTGNWCSTLLNLPMTLRCCGWVRSRELSSMTRMPLLSQEKPSATFLSNISSVTAIRRYG